MSVVHFKSLIARLNRTCQESLAAALNLSRSMQHADVEVEHWLLKLTDVPDSDLAKLVRQYDLDPGRLHKELTAAVERFRRRGDSKPTWSREMEDAIREAWTIASLQYNASRIRTGHILAALLTERTLARPLVESVPELGKVPADRLLQELPVVTASSIEAEQDSGPLSPDGAPAPSYDGGRLVAPGSKTPNLDQFTTNLTERAKKGEIDPVIGRDFEIRQVIDILTRRRQNNPILTGEAGVGKTAVVEGFALRVVAGDVPPPLKGVAVRTLDLGLLQAGAGVKGEFENRLKGIIAEVKASPQPIILFIDEAHTVIGAGGAAGSGDAANLLKPALARGELRTIAATTWMEYKKYFEEDPALKRRFQVVKVEEPDIEKASRMLRGVAATLEKHHKVRILDEAVEDAVKLSHRYITDRQLPDKAVSLLDTACARVGLSQSATPAALEDCVRDLEHLQVEIDILQREKITGEAHDKRLKELEGKRMAAQERKAQLDKQLAEERKLVTDIQNLRTKIEAAKGEADSGELVKLRRQLQMLQGETPLVHPVVDRHAVAAVVAGWTGIPVGKMVLDEIKTVLSLPERLEERVIGQSHALEVIAERMRTSRAQLLDPKRPIGVFMFVGPSGVGKTETALALSDILYGGSRNLVTINMSEYKEEHKVSRLTGSAPGYVGYGQGGVLTEAVRRKPYSIVLLDEVEKAHVAVQEIFYQVFDKGTLQDDRGTEVDFKNTIILLTSNVGTDTIMKVCADPDTRPDMKGLAEALRPDLLKSFKPALLGRITIVPYFPLGDDVVRKIIQLQLRRVGERMQANHGVPFEYSPKVVDTIAGRCKEVESGARNVDQIITGTLLPSIAQEMLKRMAEGKTVERAKVDVNGEGGFTFSFGAG
jgi:type VI secretion system protein VasG